jgi:glycosyltransferase involved in cell wall biosynthesis
MKLGFHYHIPYYKENGHILVPGFFGVFLDSLADNVNELVCFLHEAKPSEQRFADYELRNKNIRIVSMGIHGSVPGRIFKKKQIFKSIKEEIDNIDLVLVRAPSPLVPYFKSYFPAKPLALLIVGDYVKSSQDLQLPFWKKTLIQIWAKYNQWQQNKLIKDALVFVNSILLFQEYSGFAKHLHQVKTTTLTSESFFFREDTCNGNVIKLLYTGRIDLSKGLLEMTEALEILTKKGVSAELHFVGWEENENATIQKIIEEKARKLNVSQYVVFHGKKKIGEELNNLYRMADIYLMGSKISEGFPRTIWEAMANGLPVIASSVGSIPLFLKDRENVLLIEPGSTKDMVNKIEEVINNKDLRKRLVMNGFEVAKENTLEIQAKNMIGIIKKYLLKNAPIN